MVEATPYRYTCMKCNERMVTRTLIHGDTMIEVEECLGCRARFFDYNEFEKLLKGTKLYMNQKKPTVKDDKRSK